MLKPLAIVCLLMSVSGCVRFVTPPSPGDAMGSADEAWSRVLTDFVDDAGKVDFASLSRDPRELEIYVAYIAHVSPHSHPARFPQTPDKIAYYINSYNALAMYGVLIHGIPQGLDTFLDRVRFFKLTEFNIGGNPMSLYDYENEVIRKAGDPRVHFALNCMSVGCPRLPRTPFRPQDLDPQLEWAAREFFNSPRHIQVDPSRGTVRLSEILDFYREDFVENDHPSALIRYVNQYRAKRIDPNFRVEFIPYDWTINAQQKARPSQSAAAGERRSIRESVARKRLDPASSNPGKRWEKREDVEPVS